jgi:undecaprenyl-diphosphatase
MSALAALFLGAVQGFAELFPLSSLGILVVLPHAVPLSFNIAAARYLPFVTALHVATALALLIYFWRDWVRLVAGWLRSLAGHENRDGTLFWMLIVGTIPAGLLGIALKHQITRLFDYPLTAAIFLVVNGLILLGANRMVKGRRKGRGLEGIGVGSALLVGVFQMFALLPGLSRSGLAMTGGLRVGLNLEDSARFAFLLATPIIGAAGLVEVPHLLHHHQAGALLVPAVLGAIAAGVVAWFSTRYLLRYFERGNLRGLGILSLVIGVLSILIVH